MRARSADGAPNSLSLVAAEIVEDDDVTPGKGGYEDFPDIDGEEFAIDRPVDDPGRIDAVAAQGCDEDQGFPVAMRGRGGEPLAARRPVPKCRHVGLDPGFVKEDQSMSFDPVLVALPAVPFAGDVRSRLLGRQHCFF